MNKRYLIALSLILVTGLASFYLPKVKYTSPDVLSKLEIPKSFADWRGKDVELRKSDLEQNFISRIFARAYHNKYGESLLLLIIDAGNFHNPKICLGMSGSTIEELPSVPITVSGRTINPVLLYAAKNDDGTAILYWLCVDKKISDWKQHKWKQLIYSLFNKQRIGFMVRLEIPARSIILQSRLKLAQEFVNALLPALQQDQAEYIFGK